jgi:hypothetical protein
MDPTYQAVDQLLRMIVIAVIQGAIQAALLAGAALFVLRVARPSVKK